MLKIKLARFGKKNQPHYRFVVNEARDKRDGSYVAEIGHYAPTQTPKQLVIDVEAYKSWVAKGAQPTETVAQLFARFESGNPFPEKAKKPSKKAMAKAAEAKKAEAEAKEAAKAAEAEAKEAAKAAETEAQSPESTPTEEAPTAEESTKSTKEETEESTKSAKEETSVTAQ
jgi:small subunit ribosomal protein S16